jgi:hypothetical protein
MPQARRMVPVYVQMLNGQSSCATVRYFKPQLRLRIIEPPTSARHLLAELVRGAQLLHSDYDEYTLTFTCVCRTPRYRGR